MQNGGGDAAANAAPTKRTRRPSVRLHQPYYEYSGHHRDLQRQWNIPKKSRDPPILKPLHSKNGGRDEELEESDFDDDVAIGNWKSFNGATKRKRSAERKSRKNKVDVEIEKLSSASNGCETQGEDEEEKDLSGDEIKKNNGGVKVWLKKLGLGRYAPLFEVHGVDDEVLPLLTLEDLKDMGIFEVGPRRKMFSSILKLKNGLP